MGKAVKYWIAENIRNREAQCGQSVSPKRTQCSVHFLPIDNKRQKKANVVDFGDETPPC